MRTTTVIFKNHPTPTGGLENITMKGCAIANNGSPNVMRPQILIHLPKLDPRDVTGAFVNYDGHDWHVIGIAAPQMDENTPTTFNRYAIAERIRAL